MLKTMLLSPINSVILDQNFLFFSEIFIFFQGSPMNIMQFKTISDRPQFIIFLTNFRTEKLSTFRLKHDKSEDWKKLCAFKVWKCCSQFKKFSKCVQKTVLMHYLGHNNLRFWWQKHRLVLIHYSLLSLRAHLTSKRGVRVPGLTNQSISVLKLSISILSCKTSTETAYLH